jgi:hypothetical protein
LVERFSGIRIQSGQTNWEECGPCPVFASYALEFVLQLRKKHGETSVRVAEEYQLAKSASWNDEKKYTEQNITIIIHKHNNKNR